ncbi:alpha/beta fold hydrolase [Aeromicrobium terrae]|uniref:Alpha/beta fold hydrolase n=1 Tax=Aeromicrobium terrae TaxID=2498846 RepID=A0A5C8NL49_9ACTN|nr:alpha/beta fold hydrolase [Aeromicrobium terrae]TXL61203.1 alpha/beta fold hydrolase [Aeromicrobium terrae]
MTRLTEYSRGPHTFDVIDAGPEDGTPVVLLHGFPQRATCWDAVAPLLHQAGARTYAPDQRGYSPRARPRSRFSYRVGEVIDDAKALIDQVGQPVHVVAHDWGAMVGWGLAARYPEVVRSLTAVSVGHPAAFMRSMLRSTQGLKSYYMALFQLPFVTEWLLSRRGGLGERLLRNAGMSREMLDTYFTEIVEDGALRGGLGWYRSLPISLRGDYFRRVSVPTTLLWSTNDVALGRKQAELTRDFVTGPYELVEMDGASHWIPDQEPKQLAEVIIARAAL